MIISGSRYKKSVDNKDGVSIPIAVKDTKDIATRTTTITSRHGDTFDNIAARVLGDSSQYWKVAGLNPYVRFPDVIPIGTVIVVPVP
jgi:nucleoid-associated protein YgaU